MKLGEKRTRLLHSELAEWLARAITPEEAVAWPVTSPETWITESAACLNRIFG